MELDRKLELDGVVLSLLPSHRCYITPVGCSCPVVAYTESLAEKTCRVLLPSIPLTDAATTGIGDIVFTPNSESCVCTSYQNIDIHLSMHQPNVDINNLFVCISRNQNIAENNTDLCQFQVFEEAQHPQQLQAQGCLRDVQKARPVENMMFAAHLVEHMESRL